MVSGQAAASQPVSSSLQQQQQSLTSCLQMVDRLQVALYSYNGSNSSSAEDPLCSDTIPTTTEVFRMQPVGATIGLVIAILVCVATVGLFIEQAIYVYRHFGTYGRRSKTIVVLGVYPVFSFTSLLGYAVPRAGTLVDLMANIYLSICLLQFLRLLIDYFGGSKQVWSQIEGTDVRLRTPPCCCCLVCLPVLRFDRNVFKKLQVLVMQVAIIRPLLMFIAAVLWADGSYTPGVIAADNAYIYIATINVASTMWAVYGLIVLKNTFAEALKDFSIGGKFISLQMVLMLSVIPNLFINILVQYGVIPCDTLFSSKARGERIYHMILVLLMLPVSLIGRFYYRRKSQGYSFAEPKSLTLNDLNGSTTKQPLYSDADESMLDDNMLNLHLANYNSNKRAALAEVEDMTLTFKVIDMDDSICGYRMPNNSTSGVKTAPATDLQPIHESTELLDTATSSKPNTPSSNNKKKKSNHNDNDVKQPPTAAKTPVTHTPVQQQPVSSSPSPVDLNRNVQRKSNNVTTV